MHTGIWLGLALATATHASAEPFERISGRRIDLGLFVGGNYFSDELELGNSYFGDQVPQSGFLVGLRSGLVILPGAAQPSSLNPQLVLELETKLALSSTPGMEATMRDGFFAPVLGWRAHALLSLWSRRRFSPFLVAGGGGETVFTSSPFVDSGDTDATFHYGLGATLALGPSYGLRADLRHGLTAGRFALSSSTLEGHVGFYYSFSLGGKEAPPPVREVEIVKVAAKKPTEPPKPSDQDKDGFEDDKDQCPTQAEVLNQIDDQDGCPEVDSDNDGLLGTRDQCPDAAEDMDGFEDDNGCPEDDNDGDGRPDIIDGCPVEPEALNGFEDDDGCPDEVPPQVTQYTGIIEGIRFATGSARIVGRPSRRLLDKASVILKDYPSVRIRVSGHTDDRGKPERNQALSQKRAEAVKQYLVDKGIEESRIETIGYGPDKPVADNKTGRGRKKNRRIEFELLLGPAQIPDPRQVQPQAPQVPTETDAKLETPGAKPAETPGAQPEGTAKPAEATGAKPEGTKPAETSSGTPEGGKPEGAKPDAQPPANNQPAPAPAKDKDKKTDKRK